MKGKRERPRAELWGVRIYNRLYVCLPTRLSDLQIWDFSCPQQTELQPGSKTAEKQGSATGIPAPPNIVSALCVRSRENIFRILPHLTFMLRVLHPTPRLLKQSPCLAMFSQRSEFQSPVSHLPGTTCFSATLLFLLANLLLLCPLIHIPSVTYC